MFIVNNAFLVHNFIKEKENKKPEIMIKHQN